MPHLAKFRKGWSNENLAQFILYKFAFTANPSKIADDIGIDFFCTLFKTQAKEKTTYLFPKNSFAIQIKSNKSKINVSDKIDLYNNLEIPFFIGVANQNELKLSIYSGEFFQPFFSYIDTGKIQKLHIKLTDRAQEYTIDNYFEEEAPNSYVLYFPFLTEISANEKFEDIRNQVSLIQIASTTILDNISSKRNNEYIFTLFNKDSFKDYMFAGSGSVKAFRKNMKKRITEAFYNLNWLYDNNPNSLNLEEYLMYKEFYKKLEKLDEYKPLPKFLVDTYKILDSKIS